MLSPEALNLFSQLLRGVQLSADDPELLEKAQIVVRVRAEVLTELQALSDVEKSSGGIED